MDFENFNKTELIELHRIQHGRRISRSTSNQSLIEMMENGRIDRISPKEKTRAKLQVFIKSNWSLYQTNLPCRGQINEGQCTVFKCPEARHVDCYLNVKSQIKEE